MHVNKFQGFGGLNPGMVVKMLRVQNKNTQEELAELCNTSTATISNIETNKKDVTIGEFEFILSKYGYHLEIVSN